MSEFEVMPVGTQARIEALQSYARRASDALAKMARGGRYDVPALSIADQFYADPLFCEARVETRIRNAGRRYRPIGGKL